MRIFLAVLLLILSFEADATITTTMHASSSSSDKKDNDEACVLLKVFNDDNTCSGDSVEAQIPAGTKQFSHCESHSEDSFTNFSQDSYCQLTQKGKKYHENSYWGSNDCDKESSNYVMEITAQSSQCIQLPGISSIYECTEGPCSTAAVSPLSSSSARSSQEDVWGRNFAELVHHSEILASTGGAVKATASSSIQSILQQQELACHSLKVYQKQEDSVNETPCTGTFQEGKSSVGTKQFTNCESLDVPGGGKFSTDQYCDLSHNVFHWNSYFGDGGCNKEQSYYVSETTARGSQCIILGRGMSILHECMEGPCSDDTELSSSIQDNVKNFFLDLHRASLAQQQ